MMFGEIKIGLDVETASRVDDFVMQLRAIAQHVTSLPENVLYRVDQVRAAKAEAQAAMNPDPWENKPQSMMGWEQRPPENIREAVGQAIGRGSACWSNLGGAGVFKSEDAAEVVNELIDWLQSEWLPGQLHERQAKNAAAVNEMSVPRHFDATVKPLKVTVEVGDRTVGTFTGSARTGRWEITSTPYARKVSIGAGLHDSLEEAIHAAMQGGSWENIGDVPVWLKWEMPYKHIEPDADWTEKDETY
jgi:hypothetical protein